MPTYCANIQQPQVPPALSSITFDVTHESLITMELAVGVARIETNGALVWAHILGIVCVS